MACPKAPNLVQIRERKSGHWKECGPPTKPELTIAVCRLTSQWSGRLRAAHSGAAHRRVRRLSKESTRFAYCTCNSVPEKVCTLFFGFLKACRLGSVAVRARVFALPSGSNRVLLVPGPIAALRFCFLWSACSSALSKLGPRQFTFSSAVVSGVL